MQNTPNLSNITLTDYLAGYWNFLETCGPSMTFIHYEDFCQDPNREMELICEALELDYDRSFIDHWMSYFTITGDIEQLDKNNQIRLKIYPKNSEILKIFEDNQDYHKIISFLNY